MTLIFEGNVSLWPYGQNCLVSHESPNADGMYENYFIGDCKNLRIHDLRKIGWKDSDGFKVDSYAKIEFVKHKRAADELDVYLYPYRKDLNNPEHLLYIGTSDEDGTIRAYETEWEVLGRSEIPNISGFAFFMDKVDGE